MEAYELIKIMRDLLSKHEDLKFLSEEKKEVLVGGNIRELNLLVERENALLYQISKTDQRRVAWMEGWCKDKGHTNPSEWHLKQLLSQFHPDEREELDQLSVRLSQVMKELQNLNHTNRTLIEQSLSFVSYQWQILLDQGEQGQTYDTYGVNQKGSGDSQKSWMDKKI